MKTLVEILLRYESDTFSASAAQMTRAEAEQVAARLVARWAARYLDGVSIGEAYAEVCDDIDDADRRAELQSDADPGNPILQAADDFNGARIGDRILVTGSEGLDDGVYELRRPGGGS